jgi:hypothetical protein
MPCVKGHPVYYSNHGVHIGGPYLGSKMGVYIGGPKWGSIFGVQNRGPYWGSKMGVQNWGPKLGSKIRVQNWGPKWGSIGGHKCLQSNSIYYLHLADAGKNGKSSMICGRHVFGCKTILLVIT